MQQKSNYHSSDYHSSFVRFERHGDRLIPVKVLSIPDSLGKLTVIRVTELSFPLYETAVSKMPDAELGGWVSERALVPMAGIDRFALILKGMLKEAGHDQPCLALDSAAWESHEHNLPGVPSPYFEEISETDELQEAA